MGGSRLEPSVGEEARGRNRRHSRPRPSAQLLPRRASSGDSTAAYLNRSPLCTEDSLMCMTSACPSLCPQAVVFLVQHGPQGSLGLVLNRPTGLKMKRGRGGLPLPIDVSAPTGRRRRSVRAPCLDGLPPSRPAFST